ncbi:MAG: hypothetical protein HY924_02935 [Elusimicrobia bacterium]|nr:hypothetical protein [Elusimicrobiota bacterium]
MPGRSMVLLLLRRKARGLLNTLRGLSAYEGVRNLAFAAAGAGLLFGLYSGFYRLLAYLDTVELIGRLLLWKLTAMMMLTTFSMVSVSGLLTSLTTLYFSFDLRFLMQAPLSVSDIFIEKSLESIFFASWMIGLVLIPFIIALAQVCGYGWGFHAAFVVLLVPFLALAASAGIAVTLVILYLFPSSRTRDAVYVLATLSLTLVYALIRFAEPERLIRPDALHVVADYLNFLKAPTAPYVPSWWLTKGLSSYAAGQTGVFWTYCGLLYASAGVVYGLLLGLARRMYYVGYSGAQEGVVRRLRPPFEDLPECRVGRWLGGGPGPAVLFWRERKCFFRDVKHWSQILLILGLIFVYLYSVKRLPLDNGDIRSILSFLNVGVAGFVIAALGLRFTFPGISLEGRSWWVVRSAPVAVGDLMRQKFLFSAIPMTLVALALGVMTNRLLDADPFTARLSLAALLVMTWAVVAMGVGYGALFPMFTVENIHQIESSLGGFVYMASSLAYVGTSIMILSWPMQMHFKERFGDAAAWDWRIAGVCAAAMVLLNAAAFLAPWVMGRRRLEAYEGP